MTAHVRHASAWRNAKPYARHSGSWREVKNAYVRHGGSWREFYVNAVLALPSPFVSDAVLGVGTAVANYIIRANGRVQHEVSGGFPFDVGAWITPQANMTDYQLRTTLVSGSLNGGQITTPNWIPLGTIDYSWFVIRSSPGQSQAVVQIEIRRASDGVVLVDSPINLLASFEI